MDEKKWKHEKTGTLPERRKAKRFYEHYEAFLDDPESLQTFRVGNLSLHGFFLHSNYTLEQDANVRCRFIAQNHDDVEEITVRGVVVRSINKTISDQHNVLPGMGIMLQDFPSEKDEQLYFRLISDLDSKYTH